MFLTWCLPIHHHRFFKRRNSVVPISQIETDETPFTSRYMTEFDPIACLGKGGFGVVFQAKKKFDECEYAIKRITLPKRQTAKENMMREVKALAKLDHRNIVRYYNAWLECPPCDWQIEHDKELLSDFSSLVDNSTSIQSRAGNVLAINFESQSSFETGFFDEENKKKFINDSLSIVFESSKIPPASVTKDNSVSQCNQKSESNLVTTNISPVYLYIQMQLCCKQSLKDWLTVCPIRDRKQSLAIFGQIVEAVEYVHFRRLIHRDLKPSNIFFSLEGQIKVGDFGLVTSINEYDSDDENMSKLCLEKSYTNAVGTHLYMSLEQLNGQQYDSKVDIYSLGIILFELLVVFNTEMERINVLSNLRQRKYPKEYTAIISKEFKLLNCMLSSNPKERPTATEIREQLSLLANFKKMEDPRLNFNLPTSVFVDTLVN